MIPHYVDNFSRKVQGCVCSQSNLRVTRMQEVSRIFLCLHLLINFQHPRVYRSIRVSTTTHCTSNDLPLKHSNTHHLLYLNIYIYIYIYIYIDIYIDIDIDIYIYIQGDLWLMTTALRVHLSYKIPSVRMWI